MKLLSPTATKTLTGTLCLGVALSSMACSSSPDDHAYFLTLVGDRNVYLENGERYDLQVRYHDSNDEPLAGVVDFIIDGQPRGARLVSSSGSTDSNGIATVTLDASADRQAQFFIEASASDAGTATFSVTIQEASDPLEVDGTYQVDSTLNVVEGLQEGAVRNVVHGIIDFTEDPGTYLLLLVAEHTSFVSENQAKTFGPALTTILKKNAPDLVNDLLQLGENFGDIATSFGVVSELSINGRIGSLSADHKLTGVVLAYGSERHPFTMAQMNVDNVEAQSVRFAMEDNESAIALGEHEMPFSYGAMLRIALEQVLIPAISDEDTLVGFLQQLVPCDVVAQWLEETVNIDSGTGQIACDALVSVGANQLLQLIERLDSDGLKLVISGTAKPVSTNGNEKVDVLRDGTWEGTLEYAGRASAVLDARDNEFRAQRIAD